MVVWQDAGRPILKNQQCVWEPSPPHSRQLSVIFVHFFPVFPLFHDIISSFSFNLFSNFPLLKKLIAVSCASGDDLKLPLNQLCCSFAELVSHIVLSDSSLVVVNEYHHLRPQQRSLHAE